MIHLKGYTEFEAIYERKTGLKYNSKDIEIISELDFNSDKLYTDVYNKLLEMENQSLLENKFSEKAKSIFNKIARKAKGIVNFIKYLLEEIRKMFITVIDTAKNYFIEQLKGDKVKEIVEGDKKGLMADIKTSKEIIKFYREKFFKNLSDKTADIPVNESSNIIANLIHKIESIPPFSLLHKVAKSAEKGANALIAELSDFTQKMGGTPFSLPVIALILGLFIEYIVKDISGNWLLDTVGSGGFGMVIKGIKITATFVAAIIAIDSVIGSELLKH